jgi:cytochrome oxidase Cu insertion factor (SCO1/SenC/PrrC family)
VQVRSTLARSLLALLVATAALAHEDHPEAAPPPARLFEPPPAGSYELPVIDHVASHTLLDSSGGPSTLPGLAPGQVAVVAFVYGDCGQACPLALATLQRLDRTLARTPALGGRVRLATVSFDPARDDPARLRELRRALAPAGDWRFLTAPDEDALAPVIADYGQDVERRATPEGDAEVAGHTLRVFLVDAAGGVRNVYSLGFLDPEILRNDAATVLGVAPEALEPGGP